MINQQMMSAEQRNITGGRELVHLFAKFVTSAGDIDAGTTKHSGKLQQTTNTDSLHWNHRYDQYSYCHHARTHARMHIHTHTHTHTSQFYNCSYCAILYTGMQLFMPPTPGRWTGA